MVHHMMEKNNNELTQQQINSYKINLEEDLKDIDNNDEISHLKKEIESIRAEIYNLKLLATKK